jgi:hypothetical protein
LNALKWDYLTSRQIRDDLDIVIREKVVDTLSANITQEIMWTLVTQINKNLQAEINQAIYEKITKLGQEDDKLTVELKETLRNAAINSPGEELSKQLPDAPDSSSLSSAVSENIDEEMLRLGERNSKVTSLLTDFIRSRPSTGERIDDKLLELTAKQREVGYQTGMVLGLTFRNLSANDHKRLLDIIPTNQKLANGFGLGVGVIFERLERQDQEKILEIAGKSPEFSLGLGNSLSGQYSTLDKSTKTKVLELATVNNEFARGLGQSLFEYYKPVLASGDSSASPSTKSVPIKQLKYESDMDLGFIVKPGSKSISKQFKCPVHVTAEIDAPETTVELLEIDIVSITFGLIILKVTLSGPQLGLLGPKTVKCRLPWKLNYDVINSLQTIKDANISPDSSVKIVPKNTSKYIGRGTYECILHLEADQDILDSIEYVTYLLHPTFKNPIEERHDPRNKFELVLTVWGEFRIQIKMNYKDGHIELLSHWLTLTQ